ncbi:MAG: DUF6782 family putative metallopeptidase [Cyanobacteria bacterium P01_H01_bin.74]
MNYSLNVNLSKKAPQTVVLDSSYSEKANQEKSFTTAYQDKQSDINFLSTSPNAMLMKIIGAFFSLLNNQTGTSPLPVNQMNISQQPGFSYAGNNQGLAAQAKSRITTDTSPENRAMLEEIIDELSTHPEGAKLLEKAIANGTVFKIGDPGEEYNGIYNPNTNTIVVSPSAQYGVAKTFVHELVHAATPNDGNSQDEEGIADALAFTIVEELGLLTDNGLSAVQEAQIKELQYPELQESNGIVSSLNAIGLGGRLQELGLA